MAVVQERAVEQTFEWLATLDGSTNAEIRPRVEGYVRSVAYQEGSVVQEGALLFVLDDRPLAAALLKARGDYQTAVAQLDKARADVARYRPLVAARAISREELDNALASEQIAAASVVAARGVLQNATLNLQWAEVRSPIAGIAGIAQTRVGTLVTPSMVLTTVSTVDPIRASFAISEAEYLRYAEALNHVNDPRYESRRYLELVLLDDRVHPEQARRIIVGREFDPTTGTLQIQALFPNPGNILRPGLFAKVRVHSGAQTQAVLVPQCAVRELQGTFQVYVVADDGRAEVRRVQLGRRLDDQRAYLVSAGLRPGERVVIEGQERVRPGEPVQPIAARPAPPDAGDGGAG